MIQRTGADVTIDVPAATGASAPAPVRGCASVVGCASVPLALADGAPFSWNVIGVSSPAPVPFDDVRVTAASGECRSGCTLVEAEAAAVMNDRLWRYVDRASGYEEVGAGDTVRPWDAFWVPVLGEAGDDPTLRVPAPPPARTRPALGDYDLVFSEEFDGPALDPDKWTTSFLWGPYQRINAEEQLYVDTLGLHAGSAYDPFVFTRNGATRTMKIVATPIGGGVRVPPQPPANDPLWDDNPHGPWRHKPDFDPSNVGYLSGLITSYDSFRFTHGYVEARARVPEGKGLWPAFWTLNTQYTGIAPEIDVMEYLGDDPNVVYNTYHWFDTSGPQWEARGTPSFRVVGPDYSRRFHTFGVAWEPGQIIWYVDGIETHRVASPDVDVSNQSMYLLANLAVGGNWPGSPDGSTPFPAEYEIDYIRAYEKKTSIPVDLDEYEIAFRDEFRGTSLDPTKWNTAFVWGPFLPINRELQYYVDTLGIDASRPGRPRYSPFAFDGERLTIRGARAGTEAPPNAARAQPGPNARFWDDPSRTYGHQPGYTPPDYTSGMITSYDAFSFVEGYAEIRAKVPAGDGLWPAFWLLNRYYVGDLPEIDVMEILGEEPNRVYQSWHYNGGGTIGTVSSTESVRYGPDFADDFHTYGVQWMPGKIVWYVDGQVVRTVNDAKVPYQQMYVIANLALSGPPDDRSFNSKPLDDAALPADYVIDYIRVYQHRKTP